jgi:uncharacterized SAM-binding protein YcdF (DUF218 family)
MPYYVLSPLSWAIVLAVVLAVAWRRLSRGWRTAGVALGAVFWLLAAPLGANTLQWTLESMAARSGYCAGDDGAPIVLLSGGFEREAVDVDDYVAFRFETWRRVRAAVDTWHRSGGGDLWIAGGGPYRVKESAVQARLARDWRVPASALRVDTESGTTWESAFVLRGVLPQRVRLVTSPAHQPRSLLAFRAAGFDACLVDIGSDRARFHGLLSLWPQVSSLEKAELAIYELVGLAWYRLRELRMPEGVEAPAATRAASNRS